MKKFTVVELMLYSLIMSLLSVFATVLVIYAVEFPKFNKLDTNINVEGVHNNVTTVEEPDYNYYKVTPEERYLLAKLAHSEGSICSEECQRDIVSVVFNRLESGKWRKDMNGDGKITLYDIIYYPNAFTPATDGSIDKWEPTSKDYRAVDYVVKNGSTVPTEVRYFRTDHDFSWDSYENYKVIDNVYFGYFTDWQKGAW